MTDNIGELFFSRQKSIKWFSQEKISSKTVVIFGVGGIGTNIALLLARLGVKKIHLVDMDKIEASNLNRQTLYSRNDINKKKVYAAMKALDMRDNLVSEIIAHDYDIFDNWQKTVDLVIDSDIIMNGLDLPEIKRALLGILCLRLKKPMLYAGTDPHSGYSGMTLYQSSNDEEPCHECLQAVLNTIENQDLIRKFSKEKILEFETINWLELEKPDYKQPPSGSTTVVTAMMASTLAVNLFLQSIHDIKTPQRMIFDLFSNSIESFSLEKREVCLVCGSQK